MRVLIGVLAVALVALQARLWFGDGSVTELQRLEEAVAEQREENAELEARNDALAADVADLKGGLEAVEERARRELGMIRDNETFFQVTGEREQH